MTINDRYGDMRSFQWPKVNILLRQMSFPLFIITSIRPLKNLLNSVEHTAVTSCHLSVFNSDGIVEIYKNETDVVIFCSIGHINIEHSYSLNMKLSISVDDSSSFSFNSGTIFFFNIFGLKSFFFHQFVYIYIMSLRHIFMCVYTYAV